MTIPRVLEINKYQSVNPPVHIMVAAYLGVGSKSSVDHPKPTDVRSIDPNDKQFSKLKAEFHV